MRRRQVLAVLGVLVTGLTATDAQEGVRPYRIGILSPEQPPPELLNALVRELSPIGHIAFEISSADRYGEQLTTLAARLVESKVNVILAINTPAVKAARSATASIPIVMMRTSDPVRSGLVASLPKPGGNITGLSAMVDELSGKRLALLKEILPGVSRVALLWFEPNPGSQNAVETFKTAGRELGVQLVLLPVHDTTDLTATLHAGSGQVEALIVIEDTVAARHKLEIVDWAATRSLAVLANYRGFAEAGALMVYGPNPSAMYQRVAYYLDRILRGANPGDLPVEQPTKFELVINLKTAKALGLEIPPTLLARADEVIE
jgi:putative tryptophan/tyrosine transport system substrate-binding protein